MEYRRQNVVRRSVSRNNNPAYSDINSHPNGMRGPGEFSFERVSVVLNGCIQ